MHNNQENQTAESSPNRSNEHTLHWFMHGICVLALVAVFTGNMGAKLPDQPAAAIKTEDAERDSAQTIELPVSFDDLGKRMVEAGVIDRTKLEAVYDKRGGLSPEDKSMLDGTLSGNIKVSRNNAGYLLNLFWALGLSNSNVILDQGTMTSSEYGGDAGRFASTGGWTLAKGNAMSHYSMHRFIQLSAEEQELVERVSKNIYRPCCNNSTHFPDCNHGMAMLGLLELLASQGISEREMYQTALQMNAFWFPGEYSTLTSYFDSIGVDPKSLDPKEVLGPKYSSASGFGNIASKIVKPDQGREQGGCGV